MRVFGDDGEDPIKPAPHTIKISEHLPLYAFGDYESDPINESVAQLWSGGYMANKLWLYATDKADSTTRGILGLSSIQVLSRVMKLRSPRPTLLSTDDGESLTIRVTNAEQITMNTRTNQGDSQTAITLPSTGEWSTPWIRMSRLARDQR